jgi:RAB6A-GEF complex partner protein 1
MLITFSYSVEDTGPVSCIAWTPDNCAFAVGWRYRGMAVWSVSGCRLMCTARQSGLASASSPIVKPNTNIKSEPLIDGTALLQWSEDGYRLFAVEEGSSDRAIEFSFSKCCLNRGLSGTTFARQFLYGDDRVLLVESDGTDELKILQLNVPVKFRKITY